MTPTIKGTIRYKEDAVIFTPYEKQPRNEIDIGGYTKPFEQIISEAIEKSGHNYVTIKIKEN